MAATLIVGTEDRDSAKRRRREEYKQDLELQIREKDAAKQRERLQDMSVNASGWLDPEKSPERFKPLGGVHWTEQRDKRTERVRPYHTLFLYGREPASAREPNRELPSPPEPVEQALPPPRPAAYYRRRQRFGFGNPFRVPNAPGGAVVMDRSPRYVDPGVGLNLRQRALNLGTPPGIKYQPVTYAAAGMNPYHSNDQAYNFFATRDLGYGYGGGGGGGSIVQPISMPYSDNRPIIVNAGGGGGYQGPRFNPFEHRDDGTARELRALLGINQVEKDRMRRDNDDFQRRLREELERERRKLNDQEAEARRRMEELRREAEERRREAERQRREAERLRREAETRPKSDPIPLPRPASKKTMIYYDMDDYRQRLIDERKKIEELLKAGKPTKDLWELQVLKKPRLNLPPTPKSADRANRDNVRDFNSLKYRDFNNRDQFRHVYPDDPLTNRRLEQQQEALLRQQESYLRDGVYYKSSHKRATLELPPRRAVSRPSWLDRNPTPFPHVLRKRDKLYTAQSWDGDLDRIHRRNNERDNYLGNLSSRNEDVVLDQLKLRHLRPSSAETLTDDTWLHPSDTAEV